MSEKIDWSLIICLCLILGFCTLNNYLNDEEVGPFISIKMNPSN